MSRTSLPRTLPRSPPAPSPPPPPPRPPVLGALAVCLVIAVACSSSSKKSTASTSAGGPPAVANASALKTAPTISAGSGTPPSALVSRDLVVGTGPAATQASTVNVQY